MKGPAHRALHPFGRLDALSGRLGDADWLDDAFSALFARKIGVSPARYQRSVRCSVFIPDWTPHPPHCLLWIGGPDAMAIFEKTLRRQ